MVQKQLIIMLLPGFNSRLDAIQAAILRVKFKYLDNWSSLRRQAASLYTQLLSEIDGIEPPYIAEYNTTSANYYTVRLRNQHIDRNELRKYLASKDIERRCIIHYLYIFRRHIKSLVIKKVIFRRVSWLRSKSYLSRCFRKLARTQIIEVVDSIKEFFSK